MNGLLRSSRSAPIAATTVRSGMDTSAAPRAYATGGFGNLSVPNRTQAVAYDRQRRCQVRPPEYWANASSAAWPCPTHTEGAQRIPTQMWGSLRGRATPGRPPQRRSPSENTYAAIHHRRNRRLGHGRHRYGVVVGERPCDQPLETESRLLTQTPIDPWWSIGQHGGGRNAGAGTAGAKAAEVNTPAGKVPRICAVKPPG